MKSFENILNFIFTLSVSLALLFVVAPLLVKHVTQSNKKLELINAVDSINIDFTNSRKRYLQLLVKTTNKTFIKHYFIPDKDHDELILFLKDNDIIANINLEKNMPIKMGKKQLVKFSDIQIENKNGRIEKLVIDDYYVVGNTNSIFEKSIFIFMGVMFIVVGVLGILLVLLVTSVYFKTGKLPKIPNKIEGLKHLFYGLKK